MAHLVEQGTAVARPKEGDLDSSEVVRQWVSGEHGNFFVASEDCNQSGCRGDHEHGSSEGHAH